MAVVLSEHAEVSDEQALRPRRVLPRRPLGAGVLDRAARSVGQVALFAVFGICGALSSAVLAPTHAVILRNPNRRARAMRSVIRRILRAYTGSMHALRLIDLEISGLDGALEPGSLIVANHPSLIDALILLAHIDGVVVAKRSLHINPFTWGWIWGADYIVNDDAAALVETCRARILSGESLVLFPECTRTAADGVIRLRRGAAHIAVRSGCPVVPVTIEFSEPLLTKQSRWWLAPKVRPHVRIVQHGPIDTAQFTRGTRSASLAARRLTEHLEAFYTKEFARRESA